MLGAALLGAACDSGAPTAPPVPALDIAWRGDLANVTRAAPAVSALDTPDGPLVIDVDQNFLGALRTSSAMSPAAADEREVSGRLA